jgi:hypothetical protein
VHCWPSLFFLLHSAEVSAKIFAEINTWLWMPARTRWPLFCPISSRFKPLNADAIHTRVWYVISTLAYARLLIHSTHFPPPARSMSARRLFLHPSTLIDAEHNLLTASLADLADVDSNPTPNVNSNASENWERISVRVSVREARA